MAQGQLGSSWCFAPTSVCFTLNAYEAALTENGDGSSALFGRAELRFHGPGILPGQTYRAVLGLPVLAERGTPWAPSIHGPDLRSGSDGGPLEFQLERTWLFDADNSFRPTELLGGPDDFRVTLSLPEASSVFTRECGTGDASIGASVGLGRCSPVASVPEPSTWLLLLSGVVALGWIAGRRPSIRLGPGSFRV